MSSSAPVIECVVLAERLVGFLEARPEGVAVDELLGRESPEAGSRWEAALQGLVAAGRAEISVKGVARLSSGPWPGCRVIAASEFALTDWSQVAIGDVVEGFGLVSSSLRRSVLVEAMADAMSECHVELARFDDSPRERGEMLAGLARAACRKD